jgi:hypothetical protein
MSMKTCTSCPGGHFGRREFLRVGSLSFMGLGLGQFLQISDALAASTQAKARSVILVFQEGGLSQVDSWDYKSNSSFKSIPTNVPGVHFGELFPKLAQKMNKVAVIRSMHTEHNNHGEATHYALTGHKLSAAMKFPSFGSIVTKELGAQGAIPPHLALSSFSNTYKDFLKGHIISAKHDPMYLPQAGQPADKKEPVGEYKVPDLSLPDTVTKEQVEDRRTLLNIVDRQYRQNVEIAEFMAMDEYTEQAWNMINSPEVRNAFDLSQESDKTRDLYGRDISGQSALLARRMVEAGSRFVTVQSNNWDTHSNHDSQMKNKLAAPLDRMVSVLLEDLEQRGLLESTVVIVMGEFGRTPSINFDAGRDHWPECWSLMLAGGGIRGGTVVGASDDQGGYVADRLVTMGDMYATVYKSLGINWEKTYMHPIGRPIKIANSIDDQTGIPIKELI